MNINMYSKQGRIPVGCDCNHTFLTLSANLSFLLIFFNGALKTAPYEADL